jgi:peptidoglycan-associated lipoprotein
MSRHRILAVVFLAVLAFACGPKRPPNLASATPGEGGSEGAGPRYEDTSGSRPDTGPGINPLEGSGLREVELPDATDVTTEGGPLDDVYFEYDQYELTDATRAVLGKHAEWLRALPVAKVMVEGHCDERGTVEYNLALGDKRARAVREHLVSLGIPEGRLSAISLGKERPKDPGHDEAAWAKNRRAHFAVSR